MEVKYNVQLEDNRLEQYEEKLLSNFKNWKTYKRDIKLNSILENKRIEFELNISSHAFGFLYVEFENDSDQMINLKGVCAAITDLKFILNGDNVDLLEVNLKFLQTPHGKEVITLMDSGFNLILKQLIVNDTVVKFYLDTEDISDIRIEK